MKDTVKKIIYIILSPILSIIPKRKIIIMESRSDFCDSSKALFDYIIKCGINKKYKIIWIVDDKNQFSNINIYNVFFIDRKPKTLSSLFLKQYYFHFSKFCFYTHVFCGIPYNHGQIRYFLNHSSFPIKNVKGCYWNWKYNTYIEATSKMSAKYRALALGGGLSKMNILGLPRNDLLFQKSDIKKKMKIEKYKKIIIWMPTFKHYYSSERNDYNSSVDKDISILTDENINNINKILAKNNTLLIIKFHPGQNMKYVNNYNLSNVKSYTNQMLLNDNIELYSLLGVSDALITDFSSVYFDYLLLNRPIGFELADKKSYEKGRGFLVDNPLEYMPGHKIYNIKDFLIFIDDLINDNDVYKKEREILCDKIHKYKDGYSSKRIVEYLGLDKVVIK